MYHFVKYRCQFVGLYVYIPKNVVTMVICHLSKSISGWVKIRTIVYKYIYLYTIVSRNRSSIFILTK